jgi:acetyl-CoA acyltransferase
MREVVLAGAVRTAFGKSPRGTLRQTRPDDLGAFVIQALLERAKNVPSKDVDDVIFGCATPEAEQGMNVARIAAMRAGLPVDVPGLTVNRFCASGLEAIAIAVGKIALGQADVIIAGGTESMTMVPFMGPTMRPNPSLMERRPGTYLSMGLAVEGIAKAHNISREASDAIALESHQKAIAAQEAGKFKVEIVPIQVQIQEEGGAEPRDVLFDQDEGPRKDTSLEALAKLKPAFLPEGVITAGNASQRSDGAAAVLLTTADYATHLELPVLGRLVGYAVSAVPPEEFGIAPAHAIPHVLSRFRHRLEDVDLIEFNEAFAAQMLASNALYPLPMERVNVNGGAIALGHPLGATGARQTVSLLYEGRRRGAKYGLVTLCAALGMGAAALFEIYSA